MDLKEELFEAIKNNKIEQIEELIKKGVDVNCENEIGDSPLIQACLNENVSVVKLLVENKADINKRDRFDCTPLLIACKFKSDAMVKSLIELGADVNSKSECDLSTPLLCVSLLGNEELVRILLDKGADVNALDKCGQSALILACEKNKLSIAQLLLEHGANPNVFSNGIETKYKWYPLPQVKNQREKEIANYIFENEPISESLVDSWVYKIFNPLFLSVNSAKLMRLLLDKDADLNYQDIYGKGILNKAHMHLEYLKEYNDPEQNEYKSVFDIIRNKYINKIYELFRANDPGSIAEITIKSIDNQREFILIFDSVEAFRLIDLNEDISQNLILSNNRRMLEYFLDYEFQEKFLINVIETLKSERKNVEVLMNQMLHEYPELEELKLQSHEEMYNVLKDEELTLQQFKQILPNNGLKEYIQSGSNDHEKWKRVRFIYTLLHVIQRGISEKIKLAYDLFAVIREKCSNLLLKLDE
jgi:ankyrin repeat protein